MKYLKKFETQELYNNFKNSENNSEEAEITTKPKMTWYNI